MCNAAKSSKLNLEGNGTNYCGRELRNQPATRTMASFPPYRFPFASSAMPFSSPVNVEHPGDWLWNASQSYSDQQSFANQQLFSTALVPRMHEEYRAIQDSQTVTAPQQSYLGQSGVLLPTASPSHTTNPAFMLLGTTRQQLQLTPTIVLPQQQLGGMSFPPESMYTSLHNPRPTLYPMGGSTPVPTLESARADHNVRISNFLTTSNNRHPIGSNSIMPQLMGTTSMPGYFSYHNNHTNETNPAHENSTRNIGAWAPSTDSPTNAVSHKSQEPQPQPTYLKAPMLTQDRDWKANPAFPKTAALDEPGQIFPVVLHRVLTELERIPQGHEIAAFCQDGKSFQIRNQYLMEEQILPIFFPKMKSFSSFQRQLNLYNFKRSNRTAGKDRGAYRHELFERDDFLKVYGMRRIKRKGGLPRGSRKRCQLL